MPANTNVISKYWIFVFLIILLNIKDGLVFSRKFDTTFVMSDLFGHCDVEVAHDWAQVLRLETLEIAVKFKENLQISLTWP